MTIIIAKNLTIIDLPLYGLSAPNGIIPASSQVTLTDYNPVYLIQADIDLLAYIENDQVLLNDGTQDLTKEESISYTTPVVTIQNPFIASSAVTNGGVPNAGNFLILDANGKLEGRLVATDGGKLDGMKSGVIIPGGFSGTPKKASVTFTTPFLSTNYSVTFSVITDGTKSFGPAVESKTAAGFTINLHSNNVANLVEIGWQTSTVGE